jgi:hypothetical protein
LPLQGGAAGGMFIDNQNADSLCGGGWIVAVNATFIKIYGKPKHRTLS